LQAGKTHQVSTLSLHGHAQQQVTNGAYEFHINIFTIFIRDSCPWHDGGEKLPLQKVKQDFLKYVLQLQIILIIIQGV
jgi:hypothetical protein